VSAKFPKGVADDGTLEPDTWVEIGPGIWRFNGWIVQRAPDGWWSRSVVGRGIPGYEPAERHRTLRAAKARCEAAR
jgi:hypothetical protein